MKKCLLLLFLRIVAAVFVSGCTHTYPEAKLKGALQEICLKEYGVENIDVKFAGETIGVYLPLEQFFSNDFKAAIVAGKVRNPETLFDPTPEAREKMQDVLFSISRVILSTDKPLKFYILKVTDVANSGLEFVFTGYVDDIKRVRSMDISRDEYNRRILHEMRLNRAVIWHRPVRQFFSDLEELPDVEFDKKYFHPGTRSGVFQKASLRTLMGIDRFASNVSWQIMAMRSAMIRDNQVVVYAKVRPKDTNEFPADGSQDLEYLFSLTFSEDESRIGKIIPFQSRGEDGKFHKIAFAKKFEKEENLSKWEEEFSIKEVHLGDFLAQQLTKRIHALVATDERIQNTFRSVKISFEYHEGKPPYFSLKLDSELRDFNFYSDESFLFQEDVMYLLSLALQEFVRVVHSYHFDNYEDVRLDVARALNSWTLSRPHLELYRLKKVGLTGLLNGGKLKASTPREAPLGPKKTSLPVT